MQQVGWGGVGLYFCVCTVSCFFLYPPISFYLRLYISSIVPLLPFSERLRPTRIDLSLTLRTLGKIFSRHHFEIFSYFPQKTRIETLSTLGRKFSRQHFEIFYQENKIWQFMQWRQFAWNVKSCFLWKIRKSSANLLSAELDGLFFCERKYRLLFSVKKMTNFCLMS